VTHTSVIFITSGKRVVKSPLRGSIETRKRMLDRGSPEPLIMSGILGQVSSRERRLLKAMLP
jgi:hypothetical protein